MGKLKLILGAFTLLLVSVQVNAARVDVTVDFTGEYLRSSTVTNNSDDGLIINRITYGLGEADDGIGTWDSTDGEFPNLPPDSYATDFLLNPEYFQTLNFDVYLEPGDSYSEGSPTTRPFNDFDLIVRLSPLMVNGGATATSYALSRAYAEVEFITGDIFRVPLIEQDPSLTQTVYITGEIGTSLINGGFEVPPVNGNGEYEHRNGDELTGWTLFSDYRGTVHFDTDYAPVSEGSQAVQIEVPGDWISQSFATEVGQTYLVSFDLSAFPEYGGPNRGSASCNLYCDSILGVSIGSVNEVFTGSSENYVTNTLLFTADSTVSTVKFENPFILGINDEWGNYPHLDNVTITPVSMQVTIDIKPDNDPNEVNLRSRGIIPVAVLGSIDFDATQVDFTTVTFGPNGTSPIHDGHVEDVNGDGDGDMDMLFHFITQETGIVCGDTEATLTGQTFDEIQFTGTDTLTTVGCN